jgi:hypothetical protein
MKIRFKLNEKEKRGPIFTWIVLSIIFLATVLITNAAQEWINLQQISKDEFGTIPVDANLNGIIDGAEYSSYSLVSNISNNGYLSFINGTISSTSQSYDVIWMEVPGTNNYALCTYDSVVALMGMTGRSAPKDAYCAYFYFQGLG